MDKKQSIRGKGQDKISLRLLPNNLIPPFNSHLLKILEYPNSATVCGLNIWNLSLQEAFYIQTLIPSHQLEVENCVIDSSFFLALLAFQINWTFSITEHSLVYAVPETFFLLYSLPS